MIETHLVRVLNTYGVFALVALIVFYEISVARKYEVAIHIVLSVVFVLVFTVVLKELFLVPRPYLVYSIDPAAGLNHLSSLPSSHTAVAFVLATTVTLHQKRLGVFLFTLASLISIGRVMASVHYPVDIVIGILIGVLTGVIFNQIHLYKNIIKVKSKRT